MDWDDFWDLIIGFIGMLLFPIAIIVVDYVYAFSFSWCFCFV